MNKIIASFTLAFILCFVTTTASAAGQDDQSCDWTGPKSDFAVDAAALSYVIAARTHGACDVDAGVHLGKAQEAAKLCLKTEAFNELTKGWEALARCKSSAHSITFTTPLRRPARPIQRVRGWMSRFELSSRI